MVIVIIRDSHRLQNLFRDHEIGKTRWNDCIWERFERNCQSKLEASPCNFQGWLLETMGRDWHARCFGLGLASTLKPRSKLSHGCSSQFIKDFYCKRDICDLDAQGAIWAVRLVLVLVSSHIEFLRSSKHHLWYSKPICADLSVLDQRVYSNVDNFPLENRIKLVFSEAKF